MKSEKILCHICGNECKYAMYVNFSLYCPKCGSSIHNECEYGYGPVTPYYFCIGEDVAGRVDYDRGKYILRFENKEIQLKETYYKAIKEAEQILWKEGMKNVLPIKSHS